MKRILITGANSYVGTNVEKWLLKEPNKYYIETLDMKDENWREFDFSTFDVVFHVAGIAHIKENKKNKKLYYRVNRDLAYETAIKSKESGVSQFIFLSSMSVYGKTSGVIDKNTIPNPKNSYGKSKFEAEVKINSLISDDFKVLILRPPMIYGKDSPGNFQKLVKFATRTPLYPKYSNRRSMLYIDNLSIYIDLYINYGNKGLELPQNKEYISTTDLIDLVRSQRGLRLRKTRLFNIPLKMIIFFSSTMKKIYGDLIYEDIPLEKDLIDFETTIKRSIGINEER